MRKKFSVLTAALLVLVMVFTGCGSKSEKKAEKKESSKDNLIVAIQSDPSGLDPHKVTDRAAGIAIENLYNSLFTYTDKYGEVEPSLVKSYKIKDDGLTYELKLQEGVKFHSGNDMTSEDVKYSLERVKDGGARASQLEKIKSIETPDDNMVVIKLSSQYAPFLTYLANPLNAIVDKEVVEEKDGSINNVDAGSGPFKLKKWKKGTSVDMVAFDKYWEKDKPILKELELKTIKDATGRATALRNAEVDMIIDAVDKEISVLKKADGVALETVPGTFWEYLGMNCQSEELKDAKVRQAIAYAIDREAINKAVKMGNATVLKEANIPDSHDYYGGDEVYAKRDVEKAQKLLKEAGVKEGSLNLKLTVGSDWQYQVDAAQMIKQQLEEAGINCKIQAMESGVYFDGLNSGDFDLTVCGWSGFVDADEYLYDLFTTEGAYNQQKYSNSKVDGLLEEGRVTIDEKDRKAIYKEAQKLIAEDAPMAFLYMNSFTVAMRDNVKGYTVHPTAATIFMKDVYFE